MPKASLSSLPLPGALFAIAKPSGPTCMSMLDALKPVLNESLLFNDEETATAATVAKKKKRFKHRPGGVKIGQGGTLDPLADGVLVLGIGSGTKQLQQLLDGPKTYRTTALLGCETDSYDSLGAVVRTAPSSHVTRERIEAVLEKFRGEITQLPPIYSALKMDGKPLYEYARTGKPLPRPIEPRKVTIHYLECVGWQEAATSDDRPGHHFKWPTKQLTDEQRQNTEATRKLLTQEGAVEGAAGELEAQAASLPEAEQTEKVPAVFTLEMSVSGGTYVRTIVHDIGHAVGSSAHVVSLTRTQQGQFCLDEHEDGGESDCIDWAVFERAIAAREERVKSNTNTLRPAGDWQEWEEAVQEKMVIIER